MTVWHPVKGKCLLCDRVRLGALPVLRYKENGKRHYLHCRSCDSEWQAPTKAAVIRQKA
jgi:formate dehydrogenase maturation protein FdhE